MLERCLVCSKLLQLLLVFIQTIDMAESVFRLPRRHLRAGVLGNRRSSLRHRLLANGVRCFQVPVAARPKVARGAIFSLVFVPVVVGELLGSEHLLGGIVGSGVGGECWGW